MRNTTSLGYRRRALAASVIPALAALASPALAQDAFTDLGGLGGTYIYPNFLSADGTTVVGGREITGNMASNTFRWVDGEMTDLGSIGGTYASTRDISADGAVIVGYAYLEGNAVNHAFRWANGEMTDLGTLGGLYSYATAVSADGAVVVGDAITADSQYRAFRWDAVNLMQDLGTLGGTYSYATGVSADGAVVVGDSVTDGGQSHAFRWANGIMEDLGTLDGGTHSNTRAVSADGLVVVGTSGNQAFRWSTTDGMQSVDDWVIAGGGEIPDGYSLTEAMGVSDDGSVVMGRGSFNNQSTGWLAKGSGFLSDTAAFDRSVIESGGSVAGVGIGASNLALEGSHHRTLLDSGLAMSDKGTCAWSTVDAARNKFTDANTALAEIGVCGDVGDYRIGAGVGTTATNQDWDLGGTARYDGNYILAEIDRAFATAGGSTLQASLLAYHASFDTTLNRAYANGAGTDVSTGRPDLKTSALKARLDWKNAAAMGSFAVSPYSTVTVTRAKVGGYTETGGGFPAVYSPTTTTTADLRIGTAFAGEIASKTTLHTQIEAVHQFQDTTAGINGQVTGLYAFNLPGQSLTQNWARVTMDVDYAVSPTTVLTAGFNAATKGNQSSAGITLGLRAAF